MDFPDWREAARNFDRWLRYDTPQVVGDVYETLFANPVADIARAANPQPPGLRAPRAYTPPVPMPTQRPMTWEDQFALMTPEDTQVMSGQMIDDLIAKQKPQTLPQAPLLPGHPLYRHYQFQPPTPLWIRPAPPQPVPTWRGQ